MKIKLKILGSLLLLSSVSFSQIDTSRVCIPYEVAQQVAIDLVQGDLAKEELKVTRGLLGLTEAKVSAKDSIISAFVIKDSLSQQYIKYQGNMISVTQTYNKSLEKQVKRLTFTKKALSFSLAVMTLVAFLGFAAF